MPRAHGTYALRCLVDNRGIVLTALLNDVMASGTGVVALAPVLCGV